MWRDGESISGLYEALDALYRRSEEWPELVDLMTRRLQFDVSGSDRMQLQAELCELYVSKLEKPEMALPFLGELVRSSAEDESLVDRWILAAK